MADGSHAPIEDVELGDQVWAVDPESGVSGPRPVTALIEGHGTKQLVDVTVGGHTVVATDEHPFWVVDGETGAWVDAQDLKAGDVLLTLTVSPVLTRSSIGLCSITPCTT